MTARALDFLRAHPEIHHRMKTSKVFSHLKQSALVELDGEELYIVKGDTLGDEEDLYIEAVIRGAAGQGALNRDLCAELEASERNLILREFTS